MTMSTTTTSTTTTATKPGRARWSLTLLSAAALATTAATPALLLAGCDSFLRGEQDQAQPWKPLDPNPGGHGDLKPRYGRHARRLSVDQLRQSIPLLFHGVKWTNSQGADMFDVMARTLGEADYVDMTKSNTEVTALFMKFMDDMAGQVCGKAVKADLDEIAKQKPAAAPSDPPDPSAPVAGLATRRIIRYPDDVDRTLRWLRLKFHSVSVKGTASTAALRRLYDKVLAATNGGAADGKTGGNASGSAGQSADTTRAWEAVCIAVLTDPEFFAY